MSDLGTPAVRLNGEPLALREVLLACKARGQLRDLLLEAVRDRIVAEAARKAGLVVSDADLQQAADTFRQTRRLQKAEDTRAWLAQEHLTLTDLETRFERELLRRKLTDGIDLPQVERYFAENRSFFDRCVLSQLVVEREGVAQELLSQIQDEGADFGVLARKHSLHKDSRQAGGFLGVVGRKALTPAVEAAVFGAAAGSTIGPFATPQGWILVRVEQLLPATLDDATAATIRGHLFNAWLATQVRQADIEWTLLDSL
jgi:parvulin-like peptidyl-prolyl isomerase